MAHAWRLGLVVFALLASVTSATSQTPLVEADQINVFRIVDNPLGATLNTVEANVLVDATITGSVVAGQFRSEVRTGGSVVEQAGLLGLAFASGTADVADAFGIVGAIDLQNTAHYDNAYGLYSHVSKAAGASVDRYFGVWVSNARAFAANGYAFWYDGGGNNCNAGSVYRVNDFGIPALYNPCFAAYTPGAANFERLIFRWGDTDVYGKDNVAYIGVEPGGTGTNRHLQLIGGGLSFSSTLVTPATSGTRFLCISTTGVVRSSATACVGK